MPQPKGKTGNPAGRPKGTKNKVTAELKERIKTFLDANFESVTGSFNELDAEKKILLYEKFLGYVVPKVKENDYRISFSKLNDEEVTNLLTRLIQD
jgi:hypothetical protein